MAEDKTEYINMLLSEHDKMCIEIRRLREQNHALKHEVTEAVKYQRILLKENKAVRKELLEAMKKGK